MENNTTLPILPLPIPPLCSYSGFYILSLVLSSFTMLMIVVTNVLIIMVTWRTMRSIINPGLFLSLAMSDLLLGAIVLPIDIYYAAWSAEARPSFGLCTFSGVVFDILKTVSLFSFFGISVERCVSVVFPFKYTTLYTTRNNILNVAIIWLIPTLLYGALPVCNLGMYVHKCWQSMCNLGMVNMKYLTFLMLLSVSVFVATYIANGMIYYSARRHLERVANSQSDLTKFSISIKSSSLPSSTRTDSVSDKEQVDLTDSVSDKGQVALSPSPKNSEKSNHSKSVLPQSLSRESHKVDESRTSIPQAAVQPLEEGGQSQNPHCAVQNFENRSPSPLALSQSQRKRFGKSHQPRLGSSLSNEERIEKRSKSQLSLTQRNLHQSRFRAARSIMMALTLFTLCWGPYYSCVFSIVLFNVVVTPFTEFSLLWLAISNSYMNLFVFVLTYKTFRDEFNRIFGIVKSYQLRFTISSSTSKGMHASA